MIADRPAQSAGVPARRWSPAGVTQSRWLSAVAFACAGGVVMLAVTAQPWGLQRGAGQFLPLLACVPVVLLRRWPLPVLGVVTAVAEVVTATGRASLTFGFMLGLAWYFSALALPRSRAIALGVAIGAVLGVTVMCSAFTVRAAAPAAEVVETLVPLAAAWFIADSVVARRRYQEGVAAQAVRERAAEVREERVRIAREMHDVVAHALAVITVQAGVGRILVGQRPEEVTSAFGAIEVIGRTAQDELRVVLGLLRDEEAGASSLAPTPRLTDLKDLAGTVRASGVPVELRMEGLHRRLSPSLELSIYRVMQEALTNVVKHAPGARAVAEVTICAGKVRLDVRDDGAPGGKASPGSGARPASAGAGHGIIGMRERVGAFGGWLVAGPVAGGGFQVTAEIPVEDAAS